MAIDRTVIETIRERVDIVEIISQTVTLKRAGRNLKGLCPFHQEKTPSFNVSPDMQIFKCYGCGEGGDVFKFMQKTQGLEFFEVLKELGSKVGVEIEQRALTEDERRTMRKRADMQEVCEEAAQYYQSVLMTRPEGKPARDYLEKRGISQETIEAFRLGFAPARWDAILTHLHGHGYTPAHAVSAGLAKWRNEGDQSRGSYDLFRGRLMIPILDARGRVVAFGGRILESVAGSSDAIHTDAPKYVNSHETDAYKKSKVLYGLYQARRAVQNNDRLLLVEGYFDVISLHQAGFQEAVATCGTALTPEHTRLIRPLTRTVIALFDADEAGARAAVRSMPLFLEAGIEARRLDLGDSKDPDLFVQEQGAEAFTQKLQQTEPLFELLLRRARNSHGATPLGRQKTVEELAPIVRKYPSAARSAVVSRIASALGLREDSVSEWVGRGRVEASNTPVQAGRWKGTKELNHLLWLLVHHNERVAPQIMEIDPDPDLVTDNASAKQAFALLLEGRPITEVLDFVGDPDVRQVLLAVAAREVLYSADKAAFAAMQCLSMLQIKQIDEELRQLDHKIETCNIDEDKSSYFSLVRNRQALQKRKDEIKSRFAR